MKKDCRAATSTSDTLEQSPISLSQSLESKRTKDDKKAVDYERKIGSTNRRGLKRKCKERMRSLEDCEEVKEDESDWNSDDEITGFRRKLPRLPPCSTPPHLPFRPIIQSLRHICIFVIEQRLSAQTISMDRLYVIIAEQIGAERTNEERRDQASRSKLRRIEKNIMTNELKKIKKDVFERTSSHD